jgi:hypothetical protein
MNSWSNYYPHKFRDIHTLFSLTWMTIKSLANTWTNSNSFKFFFAKICSNWNNHWTWLIANFDATSAKFAWISFCCKVNFFPPNFSFVFWRGKNYLAKEVFPICMEKFLSDNYPLHNSSRYVFGNNPWNNSEIESRFQLKISKLVDLKKLSQRLYHMKDFLKTEHGIGEEKRNCILDKHNSACCRSFTLVVCLSVLPVNSRPGPARGVFNVFQTHRRRHSK